MPMQELCAFLMSDEYERLLRNPDYTRDLYSYLSARFNVQRDLVKNAVFIHAYGRAPSVTA